MSFEQDLRNVTDPLVRTGRAGQPPHIAGPQADDSPTIQTKEMRVSEPVCLRLRIGISGLVSPRMIPQFQSANQACVGKVIQRPKNG